MSIGVEFVIDRGKTANLSELPLRSIALDGYVQGPEIDAEGQRFSFDHHAGCIRHATLSTCEMTLDALRVGLDPAGFRVYLNDLDPDSVLAAWLLLRPTAALHESVVAAVRSAGRQDALGPAVGGPGLVPALRGCLAGLLRALETGAARSMSDAEYRGLFDVCLEHLDAWWAEGAPAESERFVYPPSAAVKVDRLKVGAGWVLAECASGLNGFRALYAEGVRAAVVTRALLGGTREYTVGKASEFVAGFPVPRILAALGALELACNPGQSVAHNWGGGSTIGGSPRNPDGAGSVLTPEQVWVCVEAVVKNQERVEERHA